MDSACLAPPPGGLRGQLTPGAPPARPGSEGHQRTARADLPETKDGSSARVPMLDQAEARPQDFFA